MAHILIIEPDNLLSANLEACFANANHTADVRSDPQAAITSADQKPPDLVIAELQLAGRSGAEFLYEFRSYPDWQATPIIIFTNLRPEQITGYQAVFNDLKISACLHKTQNNLSQLLQTAEESLLAHAKV